MDGFPRQWNQRRARVNNIFVVVVVWTLGAHQNLTKVVRTVPEIKDACSIIRDNKRYEVFKVALLPGLNKPVVTRIEHLYCGSFKR